MDEAARPVNRGRNEFPPLCWPKWNVTLELNPWATDQSAKGSEEEEVGGGGRTQQLCASAPLH